MQTKSVTRASDNTCKSRRAEVFVGGGECRLGHNVVRDSDPPTASGTSSPTQDCRGVVSARLAPADPVRGPKSHRTTPALALVTSWTPSTEVCGPHAEDASQAHGSVCGGGRGSGPAGSVAQDRARSPPVCPGPGWEVNSRHAWRRALPTAGQDHVDKTTWTTPRSPGHQVPEAAPPRCWPMAPTWPRRPERLPWREIHTRGAGLALAHGWEPRTWKPVRPSQDLWGRTASRHRAGPADMKVRVRLAAEAQSRARR